MAKEEFYEEEFENEEVETGMEDFLSLSDYEKRKILGNEKLEWLSRMADQATTDADRQKYIDIWATVFDQLVTDAKNNADAELRRDSYELETAKAEEESRSNSMREIIDIGKAVIGIGGTIFAGVLQWKMFKRSTRKEEDEAYLTTTDKSVVQESLRGGFWNKIKFWEK